MEEFRSTPGERERKGSGGEAAGREGTGGLGGVESEAVGKVEKAFFNVDMLGERPMVERASGGQLGNEQESKEGGVVTGNQSVERTDGNLVRKESNGASNTRVIENSDELPGTSLQKSAESFPNLTSQNEII